MSGAACSSVTGDRSEAGAADAADDGYAYPPPGDGATGDGPLLTYAPTFDAVWNEILQPTCASPFCHAGSGDFLYLWSESVAYQSLVDAAAQGPTCAPTGLHRVEPFHPESSLLFLKLTNPPCGARMPVEYGYSGMLPALQIEQVRAWIACGALDGDGGCPGDGSPDGSPDSSPE